MPTVIPAVKIRFLAIFSAVAICLFFFGSEPALAGSAIRGYLWSSVAGWISMNCENGGTCAASDYGVEIGSPVFLFDPADGQTYMRAPISGFAWSNNFGWICFGKACDGLTDKSGNPIPNPEGMAGNYAEWVQADPDSPYGRLYGWARVVGEAEGGWISLNCDNGDPSVKACDPEAGTGRFFYVALDPETGSFCDPDECDDPPAPAAAYPGHWAWSGNDDGTGLGWIDWSLAETDWTPPFVGEVRRPQGIFEPANSPVPGVHPSDYSVTVEDVFAPIGYMLRCDLLKPNGDTVVLGRTFQTEPANGSDAVFYGSVSEADGIRNPAQPGTDPIQGNTLWFVDGCYLAGEPTPAACTGDSACDSGQVCDFGIPGGSGFCRDIVLDTGRLPFYAHHNEWTLFGPSEDFYRAVKCYAQFEGEFFQNSARCDFAGNATFSMAMNKAIPIERECVNGIDDDGNGLTDCLDPFCRSLSVDCIEHPALNCDWQEAESTIGRCDSPGYEVGDICCTRQNRVVGGMECLYGSDNDGYYDCDDPAYTPGDLCCTGRNRVIRVNQP
ncbi:hypothetical protein JW899_01710 [Candidatus Uhrbacteria bacterium]|nr:hypothetical protein [Candidatus Uhrbacteria bacterium]